MIVFFTAERGLFMSGLVIHKGKGIYVVELDEILYMEKALRKIRLHLSGNARYGEYPILEFYGKFADVMYYLDHRFMFCHRSYIINMDAIVWMAYNTIFLGTSDSIYMGRATYGKARKIFDRYLAEKHGKNPVKSCENRCNDTDFIV